MSERDIAAEDLARAYRVEHLDAVDIADAFAEVRADERARCEEQSPWLRALAAEEARARAAEAERDELRAEVERLRAIEAGRDAAICALADVERALGIEDAGAPGPLPRILAAVARLAAGPARD